MNGRRVRSRSFSAFIVAGLVVFSSCIGGSGGMYFSGSVYALQESAANKQSRRGVGDVYIVISGSNAQLQQAIAALPAVTVPEELTTTLRDEVGSSYRVLAKTDPTGAFTTPKLPSGSYMIGFYGTGHIQNAAQKPFALIAKGATTIEQPVQAMSAIRGSVTDATEGMDVPFPTVDLQFKDAASDAFSTYKSITGSPIGLFDFAGLVIEGVYRIRIECNGYETQYFPSEEGAAMTLGTALDAVVKLAPSVPEPAPPPLDDPADGSDPASDNDGISIRDVNRTSVVVPLGGATDAADSSESETTNDDPSKREP